MNRHKSIPILIFALTLLILGAIVGCKSSPPPLDQDLSPTEFFQKAQEASDDGKYALATRYYEAFLVKYPDDRDRGLWARYEIALLKYKMGDDAAALSLFDELIALYAGQHDFHDPALWGPLLPESQAGRRPAESNLSRRRSPKPNSYHLLGCVARGTLRTANQPGPPYATGGGHSHL